MTLIQAQATTSGASTADVLASRSIASWRSTGPVRRCAQRPEGLAPPLRPLGRDLDAIVLTALRRDPARRYPSAAALADDLRRLLDGLPVSARPDSLGYRIRRFVGRHRSAVAAAAVDLGFHISFSGILTFRNAEPLREVARALPRERVLIETDSPYLAPVPHRGKTNQPAFVVHVAAELARLWNEPLEAVARRTTHTTQALFGLSAS